MMPWVFYFRKNRWEKFDDDANDRINQALSQDPVPEEVGFRHYYGKNNAKHTDYTVNFKDLVQTNPDSGTMRKVAGFWNDDENQKFDWQAYHSDMGYMGETNPPWRSGGGGSRRR